MLHCGLAVACVQSIMFRMQLDNLPLQLLSVLLRALRVFHGKVLQRCPVLCRVCCVRVSKR